MSWLFTVEGKKVVPHKETLLIYPYNEIWERDKSPGKELALREYSYIEFTMSMLKTNPYRGYSTIRKKEVLLNEIIKDESWVEDILIVEGMAKLKQFQTEASPTYSLYASALRAKDKLQNFLDNFDINERNEKTNLPIYKPKEITSALLDIDKVVTSLATLSKKVEEELYEAVKTKGQKDISPFANPNSLK